MTLVANLKIRPEPGKRPRADDRYGLMGLKIQVFRQLGGFGRFGG